jgi:hypothetical protein
MKRLINKQVKGIINNRPTNIEKIRDLFLSIFLAVPSSTLTLSK